MMVGFDLRAARRRATLLGATLLMTACQGVIPGSTRDPPRLYELTPKSSFPKNLPVVRSQLIVETPVASSGLTTSRIAIKLKPTTLDYYARSEWTDLAPRLVQTLLIESFDNTGKFLAVGREGSGLRSDFVLKTELREFQTELYKTKRPVAHVKINLKLVRMPERQIIDGAKFEASAEAKSENLDDVIQAFDDALGAVLKKIVVWSIDRLATEVRSRRRGAWRPGRRPARPPRN
jgi:cholesterol transport system auxiliary component